MVTSKFYSQKLNYSDTFDQTYNTNHLHYYATMQNIANTVFKTLL